LSEPATQVRFYALTGNLPPRREAWRARELADDDHARAFREQLERVRALPRIAEWERIASAVQLTAEQVARGAATLDDALRGLDARVDQMLEKRRWMLAQGRLAKTR
jgi:multiple sugar transport system substrate-binding protein